MPMWRNHFLPLRPRALLPRSSGPKALSVVGRPPDITIHALPPIPRQPARPSPPALVPVAIVALRGEEGVGEESDAQAQESGDRPEYYQKHTDVVT